MSGTLAQFVLQVVPIPVGMLLMMVLKETKLTEAKVKVRCAEEIGCADDATKCGCSDARPIANGLPISCTDIRGAGKLGSIRAEYAFEGSGLALWRGYIGEAPDMHDAVFRRIAYDLLLTNGSCNDWTRTKPIREKAFAELGLIDSKKLNALGAYLRRHSRRKIEVFAQDRHALIARMLSFRSESGGLLMAYLIGYGLDVRVA